MKGVTIIDSEGHESNYADYTDISSKILKQKVIMFEMIKKNHIKIWVTE